MAQTTFDIIADLPQLLGHDLVIIFDDYLLSGVLTDITYSNDDIAGTVVLSLGIVSSELFVSFSTKDISGENACIANRETNSQLFCGHIISMVVKRRRHTTYELMGGLISDVNYEDVGSEVNIEMMVFNDTSSILEESPTIRTNKQVNEMNDFIRHIPGAIYDL